MRLSAAGICHTDLIIRDQWYPVPLPAVLGHEGAGVVEAVGAGVTLVAPGDRVGMSFDSCGHCATCRTGRPAYCHDFWAYNFAAARPDGTSALSRDGELIHAHFFGQSCFATHCVAGERNVVKSRTRFRWRSPHPSAAASRRAPAACWTRCARPRAAALAVFGHRRGRALGR